MKVGLDFEGASTRLIREDDTLIESREVQSLTWRR